MDPRPARLRRDGAQSLSLAEIANQIPPEPDPSNATLLETIAAQLQHVDSTAVAEHSSDAAVSKLGYFAALFLSPPPVSGDSSGDNGPKRHCRASISALDKLAGIPGVLLDDDVLLDVIPFADATASWSTDALADISVRILARQISQRNKTDFIVSALLETAIKPHLSKWRSARLTAAGRPAAYEVPAARNIPGGLGAGSPPWTDERATMAHLFRWALDESDATLLEAHWSSFTPFLLALLDDPTTGARVQGLQAAEIFIRKCPARILAERGIGRVLEEAILPTLQFLPTHTPESESAQLLGPAYRALILLARTRFAYDGDRVAKQSLLDKLLREGIVSAYAHSSEYIRILEVLAVQAKSIVDELGIYATKHLKDIVPTLAGAMTDPFLAQHTRYLLAVAEALHSTILNCWPRVFDHYSAEILRATVVCWLNVCDDRPRSRTAEEQGLTETLRTMAALVSKPQGDFGGCSTADLSQMVKDSPQLRALFR